jgi:hypothetical protein
MYNVFNPKKKKKKKKKKEKGCVNVSLSHIIWQGVFSNFQRITRHCSPSTSKNREVRIEKILLRVGFEPTPFRTRTLIWRLRPTRPSQLHAFLAQNVCNNMFQRCGILELSSRCIRFPQHLKKLNISCSIYRFALFPTHTHTHTYIYIYIFSENNLGPLAANS